MDRLNLFILKLWSSRVLWLLVVLALIALALAAAAPEIESCGSMAC